MSSRPSPLKSPEATWDSWGSARTCRTQSAMSSRRVSTAPPRVSSEPKQPACQEALWTATSSAFPPCSRRAGPPASPLQMEPPSRVTETVVEPTAVTANAPACSRSGTQDVAVRPYPAARNVSPVVGAEAARTTGAMSVTGSASLAITRSRSVRGTNSVIPTTFPPVPLRSVRPMVAVVFSAGAPAGTGNAGAPGAAKQLLAVRIHWASTRDPEQARLFSPSPMASFAVKVYVLSATASPTMAWAGMVKVRAPAEAAAANTATARRRRECLTCTWCSLLGS
ncbi:hypothetical protein EES43_08775 [Streptomyces sp. ADI96-02]|nr:hypothetical protein EES43_08775 [Streptomyces sp. ADI96-02]